MAEEDCINSECLSVLEEFSRIRNTYLALRAYREVQDEKLSIENENCKKMQDNMEKLSKTHVSLEKRYKSMVDELRAENENLRKINEDLKEQCDHLQLINVDRNANEAQTSRLQDEVEILKSQLLMQQEKHDEDVALMKQQHSDEIQKYKLLLNTKLNATLESKKNKPKNSKKNKKETSFFRWPELDIDKINISSRNDKVPENKCKRRKLFSEKSETLVDIL